MNRLPYLCKWIHISREKLKILNIQCKIFFRLRCCSTELFFHRTFEILNRRRECHVRRNARFVLSARLVPNVNIVKEYFFAVLIGCQSLGMNFFLSVFFFFRGEASPTFLPSYGKFLNIFCSKFQ